jgi:transcriptional regulator with XRE-family HTH domain
MQPTLDDVMRYSGLILRERRLERGKRLGDVAKATGLPDTTLARFERGEQLGIPLETIRQIAGLYGTKIDQEFYREVMRRSIQRRQG